MAEHSVDPDRELAELLEEVRRIEAQSNHLVTSLMAGGYSSVFHGSGIEFAEVREYVDGDDPRSVDWNVTARVGRPFIKEYVEERERMLVFLMDLSASMDGGFGVWSARQMAARICACLALSANSNDDRVGLIAFSQDVDRFVPPRKGVRHSLRIVRDCLALPSSGSRTELAPALEYASHALGRRSILFVMSDFFTTGWEKHIELAARHHDVVAVRLLTPELAPPDAGLVRMMDPETGRLTVMDFRSARVRKAYSERVKAWQDRTTDELRRAKIDLMEVPVPRTYDRDAVARPILGFFRMRERRGSKR